MVATADCLALARCIHSAAFSPELLRGEIRDSWQRCLDLGLVPDRLPKQVRITSQELHALIERNSYLVHVARAELLRLRRQIAGDNFVFGFADRDAVLLDVVSSGKCADKAFEVVPGVSWGEKTRGTNGLGTAAFARHPVMVHSFEHFFSDYGELTCVAAPVSDPDGEVVGILDVSSDSRTDQQHTMSTVRMSVLHMEAKLFRERFRSDVVLQLYGSNEFADTSAPHTACAGLIALDGEGNILSCDHQARALLDGLPSEAGHHFDETFRTSFIEFTSCLQAALDPLVDMRGRRYRVCICNGSNPARTSVRSSPRKANPIGVAKEIPIGFVCYDRAMLRAVSMVQRAVELSIPVLIRGETGTGKEMLAQHAHLLSKRTGRFVAVNCASVPDGLIESELFGYREGAFTGARSGGAAGLVLQADGGTLFLDEIGDMPTSLQPALLRFLDSWTVRPIGSGKEHKVNVQLITATNCDLEEAINERRFRRDLFHRLDGVEILLPPLRERSDFDQIVWDLLGRVSPHTVITEDALEFLRGRSWDGNIRELRNVLTRGMIACTGSILTTRALKSVLHDKQRHAASPSSRTSVLLDVRRDAVLDAYRKYHGNISKTAQQLGISRNTVYRALRGVTGIAGD